ncbi:MAG: hypothetical protein K2W99_06275 [Chthoniobacterales bacterium]|nr:hypothetical protein [Chthoniobacterales bacterium]
MKKILTLLLLALLISLSRASAQFLVGENGSETVTIMPGQGSTSYSSQIEVYNAITLIFTNVNWSGNGGMYMGARDYDLVVAPAR